jgi:putative transposase
VKYAFMLEHRTDFEVTIMARVFGVSRQGFYAWLRRPRSLRSLRNEQLTETIKKVFVQHKRRYGSPRIAVQLSKTGEQVNRKRVARLMKIEGLRARAAKRFKPQTTDSRHQNPVAPNLLEQQFSVSQPGAVVAGDITYVATLEGWLYVAAFVDLCTKSIVGWSMSDSLSSEIAEQSLSMAITRGKVTDASIVHSDRGVQYTSAAFRELVAHNGLRQSMSRKGNCYDNAPIESFWHTLKVELIHGEPVFRTREEAKAAIFEYIEGYYNTERIHSSLGYLSPAEFEGLKLCA